MAGPGAAWHGMATRDPARYPGQFLEARRGVARQCSARLGWAWLGKAWQYVTGYGNSDNFLKARLGLVRRGQASLGKATTLSGVR